jgi:hypothetical protein
MRMDYGVSGTWREGGTLFRSHTYIVDKLFHLAIPSFVNGPMSTPNFGWRVKQKKLHFGGAQFLQTKESKDKDERIAPANCAL